MRRRFDFFDQESYEEKKERRLLRFDENVKLGLIGVSLARKSVRMFKFQTIFGCNSINPTTA